MIQQFCKIKVLVVLFYAGPVSEKHTRGALPQLGAMQRHQRFCSPGSSLTPIISILRTLSPNRCPPPFPCLAQPLLSQPRSASLRTRTLLVVPWSGHPLLARIGVAIGYDRRGANFSSFGISAWSAMLKATGIIGQGWSVWSGKSGARGRSAWSWSGQFRSGVRDRRSGRNRSDQWQCFPLFHFSGPSQYLWWSYLLLVAIPWPLCERCLLDAEIAISQSQRFQIAKETRFESQTTRGKSQPEGSDLNRCLRQKSCRATLRRTTFSRIWRGLAGDSRYTPSKGPVACLLEGIAVHGRGVSQLHCRLSRYNGHLDRRDSKKFASGLDLKSP